MSLSLCSLGLFNITHSLFLSQLEDDIVARPNYFTTMKNFALQQPSEDWMILEFSQLGFIGESEPSSVRLRFIREKGMHCESHLFCTVLCFLRLLHCSCPTSEKIGT